MRYCVLSNNGRWPLYNQLDNMILSPLYKSHANTLIIYTKLVTMTPKVSARWRGFRYPYKINNRCKSSNVFFSVSSSINSIPDMLVLIE